MAHARSEHGYWVMPGGSVMPLAEPQSHAAVAGAYWGVGPSSHRAAMRHALDTGWAAVSLAPVGKAARVLRGDRPLGYGVGVAIGRIFEDHGLMDAPVVSGSLDATGREVARALSLGPARQAAAMTPEDEVAWLKERLAESEEDRARLARDVKALRAGDGQPVADAILDSVHRMRRGLRSATREVTRFRLAIAGEDDPAVIRHMAEWYLGHGVQIYVSEAGLKLDDVEAEVLGERQAWDPADVVRIDDPDADPRPLPVRGG